MTQLQTSFGFLISRLSTTLRARLEQRLASYDLTPSQWAVMMRLMEKEGWTQKALGDSLEVNKATIGGLIHRLEAKGVLHRQRNGEDARFQEVLLTEAGRRLAQETAPLGDAVNAEALGALSEDEQDLVVSLLGRIQRAFDA
jgi:DNA-binding MarR family transcriptional regulator